MIQTNIPNQYFIQQPTTNIYNYTTTSINSLSSNNTSNPLIIKNIQFPLYEQNSNINPLLFSSQPQNINIPLISNNYIQPLGSRLPLEKNHCPPSYYNYINNNNKDIENINNNNINDNTNNNNNNNNNTNINDQTNKNGQVKEVSEFNISNPIKKPLIVPGTHYEISQYVDAIRKNVEDAGFDEDLIIRIIENTNNKERQVIRMGYKQKYNEDIISRFQKELNGDFKEAVIGSFMGPTEYDSYCLHNAMKSLSSRETVLTEIIGSRNNSELQAIRKKYTSIYKETLKNDVAGETYGDYQKLLLALLRCQRSNSSQPNTSACANDASDLYQLGEKKRENDEETYIRIFTKSSPNEIFIINHFYKQQTGKGLLSAIDSEFDFSTETKHLLDTIIRAQVDIYGFYSKTIHDSMDNNGANISKLIRNICARHSVDLPLIKEAYERDYENTMLEDIKSKTSGNFGKVLISLVSKEK